MVENILLTADVSKFDVDFSKLTPSMFSEAFDILLIESEKEFQSKLNNKNITYKDLCNQDATDRLMDVIHLLGSLNSLVENEEYRKIEEKYTGLISVKLTEWSLSSKMYNQVVKFAQTDEYKTLSELRKKSVQEVLKDYKKSGVNLPAKEKKKLAKINQKLAKLGQKFQNNITDAQASLSFLVKEKDLEGMSERSINNAKELSKEMGIPEGKIYIDEPSGLIDDVFGYSTNEALRKKIYLKRRELCRKGKFNNTNLIDQIYRLKQEVATILGYKDFAHMVVEENMAKTPSATLDFLNKLGNTALPYAKKENVFVHEMGKKILQRDMQWWDSEFVLNQIMKSEFSVDAEKVRLYFPVDKVVNGLFELCNSFFDVTFVHNKEKHTWHPDVKYFEVFEDGKHIGGLFMDLYKRPGKTPGAWLDSLCSYENNDLRQVKPVALLVCNAPKDSGQESTFEMDEVVTLFHEMGHALHHLVSKVEEEFFSGINHVEHDAVEIPSQLLENFAYDKNVLKKITSHVQTGEALPDDLIDKIIKSKKFMGASMIVSMVRWSEMDMQLYLQNELHPYDIEVAAMKKWQVSANHDFERRRMAVFSHIFGGGYAAGYYAYQWAEVYAADGFKYLTEGSEEELKSKLKKYKEEILYTGSSKSMLENYSRFKPTEVDLNNLVSNYI